MFPLIIENLMWPPQNQ